MGQINLFLTAIGLVALNQRLGCLDPSIDENSKQMKLILTVGDLFKALGECEVGLPLWRILPDHHKPYQILKKTHSDLSE